MGELELAAGSALESPCCAPLKAQVPQEDTGMDPRHSESTGRSGQGSEGFDETRQRGRLVHLGVISASFVTGGGGGLEGGLTRPFVNSRGLRQDHARPARQDALSGPTRTRAW